MGNGKLGSTAVWVPARSGGSGSHRHRHLYGGVEHVGDQRGGGDLHGAVGDVQGIQLTDELQGARFLF